MTSLTGEELEVPAEQLADEDSCFIDCEGLKVHYKVVQPQASLCNIVLSLKSSIPRCICTEGRFSQR